MSRTLVFDAGPIISLAMNNLLGILKPLKQAFKGEFVITSAVRHEIVDKPLTTKLFMFEAMQVQSLIEEGVIKVVADDHVSALADELLSLANSAFSARGQPIRIVQLGEMATLAWALMEGADAVAMDERVTRTLLEAPGSLQRLMERRLHTRLSQRADALRAFQMKVKDIKIIRSAELAAVAYERGLLDEFIVDIPEARRRLIEAVLWGVKLKGCAISEREIGAIVSSVKAP